MASIMAVAAFATVFGRVLTFFNVPQAVAQMISAAFASKVLLLALNLFLLIVGALMDTTPAILILAPIFINRGALTDRGNASQCLWSWKRGFYHQGAV